MNQPDLFAAPRHVQLGDSIIPRDRFGHARPTDDTARRERDHGIARAIHSASRIDASWTDRALAYIIGFARTHAEFISEQCTAAAEAEGFVSPADPRAWGGPFQTAARRGVICKDGYGISLRRHLSPTPRWRSLVFAE